MTDRDTQSALDRLESKIDKLTDMIANHRVESAQNIAAITASAKSAHKRIDDCEANQVRRSGNLAALWIGLITTMVGTILSHVFGVKK